MKYASIVGLMFGFAVLFGGCNDEKEKYVKGEKIYIKYSGTAQPMDWIKIDDKKFIHLRPDTTGQASNTSYDPFAIDEAQTDRIEADGYLLTSVFYDNVNGSGNWFQLNYSNGDQAIDLYRQLSAVDSSRLSSNTLRYINEGNSLTLAGGEVVLKRSDGKAIRVSTSEGYPAFISKEPPMEYLKKLSGK
jgi:hypothetical protein